MPGDAEKLWEKNEVFLLIMEWKRLPEIWDLRSKSFRNKIKKQDALKNLAMLFNTTTYEISRKLHNLRTQFNSELRKLKKKNSGDGAEETHSTWEFFHAMKFILIQNQNTNSSTTDDMNDKDVKQYLKTEKNETKDKKTEQKIQIKRKKCRPDYSNSLKRIAYATNKPKDEFQIFGEYVASELRCIRKKQRQRMLKLEIQRAILHASEMDMDDSSPQQSCSSYASDLDS